MAYVIHKQIVARSFSRLREQKTHPLFAGYLYLQQRASQLNRLKDLQPDFPSFEIMLLTCARLDSLANLAFTGKSQKDAFMSFLGQHSGALRYSNKAALPTYTVAP